MIQRSGKKGRRKVPNEIRDRSKSLGSEHVRKMIPLLINMCDVKLHRKIFSHGIEQLGKDVLRENFKIFSGKDNKLGIRLQPKLQPTKLIRKLNCFNYTKKPSMKGKVSLHQLRDVKHELTLIIMKEATPCSQILEKELSLLHLSQPLGGGSQTTQNFGSIRRNQANFERFSNKEVINRGIGNLLSVVIDDRDLKFD